MPAPTPPLDRRELLAYSAALGSAFLVGPAPAADEPKKDAPRKRYPMKKSINQWAFPYPEKLNLEQCLRLAKDAGFDGIELNYDLDNDLSKRAKGLELAGKIVEAAGDLGVENVLVVPGAVHIPWRTDHEPVPNDVCDKRAKEAIRQLLPLAEKHRVSLNIENIFLMC